MVRIPGCELSTCTMLSCLPGVLWDKFCRLSHKFYINSQSNFKRLLHLTSGHHNDTALSCRQRPDSYTTVRKIAWTIQIIVRFDDFYIFYKVPISGYHLVICKQKICLIILPHNSEQTSKNNITTSALVHKSILHTGLERHSCNFDEKYLDCFV